MRLTAALAAILVGGASPPVETQSPGAPALAPMTVPALRDCREFHVARDRERGQFRKLGELPPADAFQAVLRRGTDGCIDPLTVSDRINGR